MGFEGVAGSISETATGRPKTMNGLIAEREAPRGTTERVLLGNEAVAQGAVDSRVAAAYAYPGTPSTEVLEYLLRLPLGGIDGAGRPVTRWAANEKTAYEAALGTSMAGGRALVAMKHVGLNVAADPFINSALLDLHAGLVLVVADDPGMHSSQNEQDSRFYAEMARVPCLEPATQQEAYDMTREAFELSERFRTPVVVRLVTRLAHSRTAVRLRPPGAPAPRLRPSDPSAWTLLPANARRRWRAVLERQEAIGRHLAESEHTALTLRPGARLGVVTAGVARGYFLEALEEFTELDEKPSHLHVGVYPAPEEALRRLAASVSTILVLEDGQPFLERRLRGVLPSGVEVIGRETGAVPPDGELDPDRVRRALGLPERACAALAEPLELPARPPQLCVGCPHRDSFAVLERALQGRDDVLVAGDIGCYTLGALPPFRALDSCVCMGASIGMALGAAEAGVRPVVAVIGDSTLLHSGLPPLLDAAVADAPMTVLLVDNEAVAMTGAQDTVAPSSWLEPVVLGLGVHPDHCRVIEAHPKRVDEAAEVLAQEIDHPGLSVVIATRECIEHARLRKVGRRAG